MDTQNEKRVYEFSYLIAPEMQEESVAEKVESLKNLFIQNGASIIADEAPEYIGLAYTMVHQVDNKNKKINSAYFGWFKFEADNDVLEKVKMTLDRDAELVRYLFIKTVAENTMAPKKLSQKPGTRRKTVASGEVKTESTEGEIAEVTDSIDETEIDLDSADIVEPIEEVSEVAEVSNEQLEEISEEV